MQYLWGLVHALQIFQFLIYMNIDFPQNIQLFAGYIDIASGNLEEVSGIMPDVIQLAVNYTEINETSDVIP